MIGLETLIKQSLAAGFNYNRQSPYTAGVAFFEDNGKHNAIVASQYYVALVSNITKPDGPFYSLLEQRYTGYKYPISIEQALGVIYGGSKYTAELTTKYSNLMNWLDSIPEVVIDKEIKSKKENARLILRQQSTEIPKGLLLAKFEKENGSLVFRHEKAPKPFIADIEGPIPSSMVAPSRYYMCEVALETEHAYIVKVLKPHGRFIFDLCYSKGLYNISDLREIVENNQPGYPYGLSSNEGNLSILPSESFAINSFTGDTERTPVIHIDAEMFTSLVKITGVLPLESDIKILIPENDTSPIRIVGEDNKGSSVNIVMNVLSQTHDKQRR